MTCQMCCHRSSVDHFGSWTRAYYIRVDTVQDYPCKCCPKSIVDHPLTLYIAWNVTLEKLDAKGQLNTLFFLRDD